MKKISFQYYLAGLVSIITFVIYLTSLSNGFVQWDDDVYVLDNPHIRSLNADFFKWAFFDFYAANWHPLTWISHALDYAVWGLNPLGHHLTNNILHAVNTFLVVLLVVRLLTIARNRASANVAVPFAGSPPILGGVSEGRGGNWNKVLLPDKPPLPLLDQGGELYKQSTFLHGRRILIAAGVTGLLFGLHPLHVESVAWVAERKDLLCGLFFLLSVMMYMSYRSHKTYRSYLLTLCFFTLALLSKPMAVTLPAVLLILDWFPLKRIKSLKEFLSSFIEKIPFVVLSLASSLLTITAQKAAGAMVLMDIVPLPERLLIAIKSLIVYLGKMVWPVNLIPYYPYPARQEALLSSPDYIAALLLVAGITVISFVTLKKQRLWQAVWGCYVVMLIPVLGFIQVGGQYLADRYTYLPSLAPFLVMGLAVAWGGERLRDARFFYGAFIIFCALILICMTLLTFAQIGIWKNAVSLWSQAIQRGSSTDTYSYMKRGMAYKEKGQFQDAIADFDVIINIEPYRAEVFYNRGSAYEKLGRIDAAIEDYTKGIALSPSHEAYYLRGIAFETKGQLDKAMEDYNKAIALNPSYIDAYIRMGVLYGRSGSFEKAIGCFDRAIAINPNYPLGYGNRGFAYSLMGKYEKALEDLNKAIELNKNDTGAYVNRGNVYLKTGDKGRARSDFQRACALGEKSSCATLKRSGL